MRTVSLLGSTGSVGTQALDVVRHGARTVPVHALAAQTLGRGAPGPGDRLRSRARRDRRPGPLREVRGGVPAGTEVMVGDEGLVAAARSADVVLNAVVGFAGLPVTMAALEAGKRLALANKESLIAGAPVVQKARRTPGAEIVPVDSEHCAVHQCLAAVHGRDRGRPSPSHRVGRPVPRLDGRAARCGQRRRRAGAPDLVHGAEDHHRSSTLMNKGLEVIEAHELFGIGYDRIDVVVHPQSIVHSMVELRDGSTIAQLSETRHAPAHRLRPRLSRSIRNPFRGTRLVRRRRSPSSLPTGPSSAASTWPTRPAGAAVPHRPG